MPSPWIVGWYFMELFLRDHAHLISPHLFTVQERWTLDRRLFVRNAARNGKALR